MFKEIEPLDLFCVCLQVQIISCLAAFYVTFTLAVGDLRERVEVVEKSSRF